MSNAVKNFDILATSFWEPGMLKFFAALSSTLKSYIIIDRPKLFSNPYLAKYLKNW